MRTLLAVCLSAGFAAAQFAVGTRDVGWPNTTGQGAATLTARVHYPAVAAGTNAAILPRSGGWPTVVFLHGFASPGTLYSGIGNAWAARGFVVVVSTTSTFDNVGQERDGRALFPAVVAAAASGPFAGAIDTARVGIAGHSMGGGNVGNVLANNPGYRCGFAIAPVDPRPGNGALVREPLAIVAGQGDTIAPANTYAVPYYQSLTAVEGVRSLYLLNGDASHTNLAGLFVSGGAGAQVFARVVDAGEAFFSHWLGLSTTALERCIGPAALAETRLAAQSLTVTVPQVWLQAPLTVGATSRVSVAAEPGLAGVAAALGLGGPTATPFGSFLLDGPTAYVALLGLAGAERRYDGSTTIPSDPAFLGLGIALQAFGTTPAGDLRFGNAIALQVGA